MATQLEIEKADDGSLPNETAVNYLRDILREVASFAEKQLIDDMNASDDGSLYDDDDDPWSDPGLAKAMQLEDEAAARLLGDEFEYEAEAYGAHASVEDSSKFSELYEEAAALLEAGEYTKFSDAFDALIGHVGPSDPEALENVERWVRLLEQSKTGVRLAGDEQAEIGKAVRAAVKTLSIELVKLIADAREALLEVEWRQLEHVVATALEGLGFEVELTPPAKDGGKDVIASCMINGKKKCYFVEIKHWRSGKRVASRQIFDFIEINVSQKSSGGVFISTSGFTESVFSCFTEFQKTGIRLGDSQKVTSICRQYVKKARGLWQPGSDLSSILFEATISLPGSGPKRA
jgi:restriction endonuclease